jgi:bifunctional UDP-N-acetylglucosamine pyrophosphorylase/glucosamine-1-phosphate N-acetyltransferase
LSFAAVILAAGKSTRMRSSLPKAVHPICGKPVTRHVVDASFSAGARQVVVVVGYEADVVKAVIGADVDYALQNDQLGTGHAAMQAMSAISCSDVLILPGDAPLISSASITKLIHYHHETGASATLLTAILDEPASYGRVVRGVDGNVERITEARDAGPEVLAIQECAMSIYCFKTAELQESLNELRTDNAQGEYYLTDTIEILRSKGRAVKAVPADDPRDTLGINTRIELADAANIMRRRLLDTLMLEGVTVVDPGTTYVDVGISIGRDTVIRPCTSIEGSTSIGESCVIGPHARLVDSELGNNVEASFCVVTEAAVADGSVIGPFRHVQGKGGPP